MMQSRRRAGSFLSLKYIVEYSFLYKLVHKIDMEPPTAIEMREATIYRRKNNNTFAVQLDGCPGIVEVCCSEMLLDDLKAFTQEVLESRVTNKESLVRISVTVGNYCL